MRTIAILALFFGLLFLTIGPVLIGYGLILADDETKAMTGELLPFGIDSQKPIEIQCGGFHVGMTLDQLSEGFNLSYYVTLVGFDYPFHIALRNQRFLVSVDLKNANGETVAKIADNQWSVNNNNVIAYDRNYNSYAFEVIDSDLVPVIQVVFKPQNRMYLGGFFYSPNMTVLLLSNNTSILDPSLTDLNSSLPRIFKYPSKDHLGETVVKSTYEVPRSSSRVITLGVVFVVLGIPITIYGEHLREKPRRRVRLPRTIESQLVPSSQSSPRRNLGNFMK
jgi:hypothetical protein